MTSTYGHVFYSSPRELYIHGLPASIRSGMIDIYTSMYIFGLYTCRQYILYEGLINYEDLDCSKVASFRYTGFHECHELIRLKGSVYECMHE